MTNRDLQLTVIEAQSPPERKSQWMQIWFGTPGNAAVTLFCTIALLELAKLAISWAVPGGEAALHGVRLLSVRRAMAAACRP